MRIKWAGNKEIGERLDVSTAACTRCGAPARVPEDVVAVAQLGGKQVAVVVCGACTDVISIEEMGELIARVAREEKRDD